MCFSVLCLTLHYIKQHFVTMHCALARYAEAVDVEHDVLFSLPMNFIWIDYNPCLLLLSRRWCHNIYHRLLQTSSRIQPHWVKFTFKFISGLTLLCSACQGKLLLNSLNAVPSFGGFHPIYIILSYWLNRMHNSSDT